MAADAWSMPTSGMATYEVTSTGPKSYQVNVITPEFQGVVAGDFSSLQAAEVFADDMRKIDAIAGHPDEA